LRLRWSRKKLKSAETEKKQLLTEIRDLKDRVKTLEKQLLLDKEEEEVGEEEKKEEKRKEKKEKQENSGSSSS